MINELTVKSKCINHSKYNDSKDLHSNITVIQSLKYYKYRNIKD